MLGFQITGIAFVNEFGSRFANTDPIPYFITVVPKPCKQKQVVFFVKGEPLLELRRLGPHMNREKRFHQLFRYREDVQILSSKD